ncbi:MAG: FtsX-like permease family protein, partial [Gemmatimonadetes bacterium]|nr:FtsX-like permease family protein [Gemmatimonadota bacterium]
ALLLTRTVDRTREVAVRAALGAGRARLARQVLTESVVLGAVAGLVGMVLAVGLFDIMVASLPLDASFRDTLGLDWVTLGSALVLAVVTGCLVALAPMRSLLRGDLSGLAMSERSVGTRADTGRMQHVLVVAEVLLAVVLVTGASLLARTVDQLRSIELGFETEGLLTLDVLLPENESSAAEPAAFYDLLLERGRALPGVDEVSLVNRLPLRDGGFQGPVGIPDRPDLQGNARPNALFRPMTPGTLEALGAEIVEGRSLLPSDGPDALRVAVVNESFARRAWGDQSAVGRRFSSGFFAGEAEVVGVVRNMAATDLIGEPPMAAYYSWDQTRRGSAYAIVVAKISSGDPADAAPGLRALIAELAPHAAVDRVSTMDEALDAEMAEALRLRFFLGLFSVLGIVLGSVGVYGVVSYSVERRKSEFGIRLALGAEPSHLLKRVIWRGLVPVLGGIVLGTVVAIFASGLLARFLFEVEPVDPVSMLSAAGILFVVGAVASLVPAVRASGTRPAVALRAE